MPQYHVVYEDVGYTSQPGDFERELDAGQVESLNAALGDKGLLGPRVLGVRKANTANDDSVYRDGRDGDGGLKAFVSVTLVIEAADEDAAEIEPPEAVLDMVREALAPEFDMEGTWECNGVDVPDAPAPGIA